MARTRPDPLGRRDTVLASKEHHQTGREGQWNSDHVEGALKYCEISAIKEPGIERRGK